MLRLASQAVWAANEDKGGPIMVLSDIDFADELIPEYAAAGDGHAGTIETSRVMAIRPDLVKGKGKADVWRMPRFEVIAHPELCIPSAVHGDPTAATKEKGEKINQYIIEKVAELVEELKR
jgi:creatinine amidohydrolase